MRKALYLDFSIPLFESESTLKDFYQKIYDISKILDRTRNIKFYISLPLDFITLNKNDLNPLMEILSSLYKEERVEFIVKDSFGVDSSELSTNVQEFNTILSEYVLGFYFGDKRNFEGDKSIMMKNLECFYPYMGKISRENFKNMAELGYRNFFLDESSLYSGSFIFNNQLIFIQLDTSIKSLLNGLLDKFSFDNYIRSTVNKNYEVYYLNLFDNYSSNKLDFILNLNNLIHFMDHTDLIEYRFVDESFEMPIEKDLKKIIFADDLTNNYSKSFHDVAYSLSQHINLIKLGNDDLHDEDLKNVALWEGTSSDEVNKYLKFNFIILSLMSTSIDSKIKLLGDRLKSHISNLLDELELYSLENKEFKNSIESYRSYINQK